MSKLKIFFESIVAGIFIGIAGTVFLSVENKVTGAFLFSLGLLAILCFQLKLFTGAVGYLVTQKNVFQYLLELVTIGAGNFIGTWIVGNLVLFSRISEHVSNKALNICCIKMTDSMLSLFILSLFCGILMFSAVESFKRKELPDFARVAMVFLCVTVFILCGFEHCIANMYYFSVCDGIEIESFLRICLMTLGNSLGGMIVPLISNKNQ